MELTAVTIVTLLNSTDTLNYKHIVKTACRGSARFNAGTTLILFIVCFYCQTQPKIFLSPTSGLWSHLAALTSILPAIQLAWLPEY